MLILSTISPERLFRSPVFEKESSAAYSRENGDPKKGRARRLVQWLGIRSAGGKAGYHTGMLRGEGLRQGHQGNLTEEKQEEAASEPYVRAKDTGCKGARLRAVSRPNELCGVLTDSGHSTDCGPHLGEGPQRAAFLTQPCRAAGSSLTSAVRTPCTFTARSADWRHPRPGERSSFLPTSV